MLASLSGVSAGNEKSGEVSDEVRAIITGSEKKLAQMKIEACLELVNCLRGDLTLNSYEFSELWKHVLSMGAFKDWEFAKACCIDNSTIAEWSNSPDQKKTDRSFPAEKIVNKNIILTSLGFALDRLKAVAYEDESISNVGNRMV